MKASVLPLQGRSGSMIRRNSVYGHGVIRLTASSLPGWDRSRSISVRSQRDWPFLVDLANQMASIMRCGQMLGVAAAHGGFEAAYVTEHGVECPDEPELPKPLPRKKPVRMRQPHGQPSHENWPIRRSEHGQWPDAPGTDNQVRQRQQALGGERAAAVGDHRERIRRRDVGPPCQEREQLPVLIPEVDPVLAPVLPVLDELEVPAGQRVERVRHPYPQVLILRIGCS